MTPTPKMTWEEALEIADQRLSYARTEKTVEALAVLRAADLQPRDLVLEEAVSEALLAISDQIDASAAAFRIRALKKGE